MKQKIQMLLLAGALIISVNINSAFGQATGNNTFNANWYLGWSSSNNLPFKLNGTQFMTLKTSGDLNLNNAARRYQINSENVLWHNNHPEDIFVGVSAGNATMTGHSNTLIGSSAGNIITTGDSNTVVGTSAGAAITTGAGTTFVGFEAGNSNSTANDNTAIGFQALHTASTLGENVAVGYNALYSVHTLCGTCSGGENTAVGFEALKNSDAYGGCALGFHTALANTIGCGIIAIGEEALLSNTEGDYNLAIGAHSLATNTVIDWNVAIGNWALNAQGTNGTSAFSSHNVAVGNWTLEHNDPTSTSNGSFNSALGDSALNSNSTGRYNTSIGYASGLNVTSGDSNVFVGYGADISLAAGGNLHNCAAFGYGTTATTSDKFYFGNVNVIECRAFKWTSTSDGRFKINVQENVSGLDFIKRLRPVTYNINTQALDAFINPGNNNPPEAFTQSTNKIHSGFIAQEVEQAELASGFTSSIVSAPSNANDPYALDYSEFVVPLVKAVKELDSVNTSLQDQINALQSGNRIVSPPAQGQGSNELREQQNTGSIELENLKTLLLSDADPNPFSESTMIRWNIPNDFKDAMIYFYDNAGTKINSYKIDQKGSGELQVFGSKLSSGVYTYSLVVDSKLIDSKRLVKAK